MYNNNSSLFQTCLFAIAWMMWLAAEYKLPAGHEPALSEKLDTLLLSMTQDDQNLRPTAADVLEVRANILPS